MEGETRFSCVKSEISPFSQGVGQRPVVRDLHIIRFWTRVLSSNIRIMQCCMHVCNLKSKVCISVMSCSYQSWTNTDDNSLGCYRLHSIQQTVQQPLLSLYVTKIISERTEITNGQFLNSSKVLLNLSTLGWSLRKRLFYHREYE